MSQSQGGLQIRLLAWMAVALAPVLLLSIVSAFMSAQRSMQERRANLVLMTNAAVDAVEQSLHAAELLITVYRDEIAAGECREVARRLEGPIPAMRTVALYAEPGPPACESSGKGMNILARSDWFERLQQQPGVIRTEAIYSGEKEEWLFGVLAGAGDVDAGEGRVVAIMLGAMDLVALTVQTEALDEQGISLAVSGHQGRTFGASHYDVLPAEWIETVQASGEPELFVGRGPDSKPLDVVLKPVGTADFFIKVARRSPGLWSPTTLQPLSSFGLPAAIFLISLLAVWMALDRLILKWLTKLQRTAREYGAGNYRYSPVKLFDSAPEEIVSLASAMEMMARDIDQRSTSLRDALAQKDAAVREIHHRVKNNLQIVTSFLSLQKRRLTDPAAVEAMANAQNRINALAIVHQTLYQHQALDIVELEPFLEHLVVHLGEAVGMAEADIAVETDLQPASRAADDAIPIALFLVEAVTNSAKYAFPEDGGTIRISLAEEGQDLVLTVSDDGIGFDTGSSQRVGLGSRLMGAFTRQLHGELSVESAPGKGTSVRLCIPPAHREPADNQPPAE